MIRSAPVQAQGAIEQCGTRAFGSSNFSREAENCPDQFGQPDLSRLSHQIVSCSFTQRLGGAWSLALGRVGGEAWGRGHPRHLGKHSQGSCHLFGRRNSLGGLWGTLWVFLSSWSQSQTDRQRSRSIPLLDREGVVGLREDFSGSLSLLSLKFLVHRHGQDSFPVSHAWACRLSGGLAAAERG